jgi:hypothetical protein
MHHSFVTEEFDIEVQGGVGGNHARIAFGPVGVIRRAHQLHSLAQR